MHFRPRACALLAAAALALAGCGGDDEDDGGATAPATTPVIEHPGGPGGAQDPEPDDRERP